MAYFIAFKAGRWRNVLLGLVMVPFFTSFLLRTIAWQSLFSDNGPVLGVAESLHLVGVLDFMQLTTDGKILNTATAVIGGLVYNFLPFMLLPIYVSLEKIPPSLIDAASDLYAPFGSTFRRVVLPLSLPGVFAGTLLTFIPASGDFINAAAARRREQADDRRGRSRPASSRPATTRRRRRISIVLMAIITVGVLVYARTLGTDDLV